MRQYVNLLVY